MLPQVSVLMPRKDTIQQKLKVFVVDRLAMNDGIWNWKLLSKRSMTDK